MLRTGVEGLDEQVEGHECLKRFDVGVPAADGSPSSSSWRGDTCDGCAYWAWPSSCCWLMQFSASASCIGSFCAFGIGGEPPTAPPPVPCSLVIVGRVGNPRRTGTVA